jgi:hypothetical protein
VPAGPSEMVSAATHARHGLEGGLGGGGLNVAPSNGAPGDPDPPEPRPFAECLMCIPAASSLELPPPCFLDAPNRGASSVALSDVSLPVPPLRLPLPPPLPSPPPPPPAPPPFRCPLSPRPPAPPAEMSAVAPAFSSSRLLYPPGACCCCCCWVER